jgi:predicted PurR-regulated permease PerM
MKIAIRIVGWIFALMFISGFGYNLHRIEPWLLWGVLIGIGCIIVVVLAYFLVSKAKMTQRPDSFYNRGNKR